MKIAHVTTVTLIAGFLLGTVTGSPASAAKAGMHPSQVESQFKSFRAYLSVCKRNCSITAQVNGPTGSMNVRDSRGVKIDQLKNGAYVTVYAVDTINGELFYKVGYVNRNGRSVLGRVYVAGLDLIIPCY